MSDQEILDELRGHLGRAKEWANEDDQAPAGVWSCVTSTLAAVNEGNVGLALTRWEDLSSRNKPILSPRADGWRACATYDPYSSSAGPHGKSCSCPYSTPPGAP